MLSSFNIFIDSVSSPRWRWLQGKWVQNARPLSVFTWEIATNDSPGEKSFGPRSITTTVSVRHWLLWIVIAQANASGSWVQESDFPALSSQCAVTGIIGIQVGSMSFHPGVAGPTKYIREEPGYDSCYCIFTWVAITFYKNHCRKIPLRIRSWIVPYLLNNTLTARSNHFSWHATHDSILIFISFSLTNSSCTLSSGVTADPVNGSTRGGGGGGDYGSDCGCGWGSIHVSNSAWRTTS